VVKKLRPFRLLNHSLRPAEQARVLGSYMRHRENRVTGLCGAIPHRQKALTARNFPLARGIISRTTGRKIQRDLAKRERDPHRLARHQHARIQGSRAEVARSLSGHVAARAAVGAGIGPGCCGGRLGGIWRGVVGK
jgi:hypothetical protein